MKTSLNTVSEFLSGKKIAVVGVSKSRKKFGNAVFLDLMKKGYKVFPVNPNAGEVEGYKCYKGLQQLPEKVDGAVLVIPPAQTEIVVKDAHEAGIKRIWMQQGAESENAIDFCRKNGMDVVHGECIMMFAEPATFPHNFHRWLNKVFGKLPE